MEAVKNKISSYLADVADLLRRYGCFMTGVGLSNGKTGVALFLYRYSRLFNKPELTEYANEIMLEVMDDISGDIPLEYDYGLSGIGVAISYLINNDYLDRDSEVVLAQFDDLIMNNQDNSDIADLHTLISVAYYWRARRSSERLEKLVHRIHSMCKNRLIFENVPAARQEMMRSLTLFYVMNAVILDKKNVIVGDREIVNYLNSPETVEYVKTGRWCDKYIYRKYVDDTITFPIHDDITLRDIISLSLKKLECGLPIPKVAYFEKVRQIMLDANLLKQLIDLVNIQSLGLGSSMSGLAWALLEYEE